MGNITNDFNRDLARALGAQLRLARKSKGMTLQQVAAKMRSHRPIVGRTEAGKFMPSLETLISHAIVVGLPMKIVCVTIDEIAIAHRRLERERGRTRMAKSVATRGADGKIVPGDWVVPALGKARFSTRGEAEKQAEMIANLYGPNVWGSKVEEEPSKTRPGATSFQVYIRSLGARGAPAASCVFKKALRGLDSNQRPSA